MVTGKSHWVYLENFVRALLDRKHEVTCITNVPMSGPKSENYTEILIDPPLDMDTFRKFSILPTFCYNAKITL